MEVDPAHTEMRGGGGKGRPAQPAEPAELGAVRSTVLLVVVASGDVMLVVAARMRLPLGGGGATIGEQTPAITRACPEWGWLPNHEGPDQFSSGQDRWCGTS